MKKSRLNEHEIIKLKIKTDNLPFMYVPKTWHQPGPNRVTIELVLSQLAHSNLYADDMNNGLIYKHSGGVTIMFFEVIKFR